MPAQRCFALALALTLTTPVLAEEAPTETGWSLGLASVVRQEPYRGYDTDFSVFPLIARRGGGDRFYVRGPGLGVWAYSTPNWRLGFRAEARLDGYEADDSDFLTGMAERKPTLEAGVDVDLLDLAIGEVGFSAGADVLSRHEGYELEARWQLPQDWLGFSPQLALRYQSDDLLNYYYGVSAAESRAGRPAYQADDGVAVALSLQRLQVLSPRWSLLMNAEIERLPNSAADSPIVDGRTKPRLLLALMYAL
ncbi:MAG: MipA/OmpV family protein [Xanthomonadales bacterium]|nr:MipA/OmpV family protein [Xanthomonadales bacterium]